MFKIIYLPTATFVSDSNRYEHAQAPTREKAEKMIRDYFFYEAWGDAIYLYRKDLPASKRMPKYLFEVIEC